MIAYRQCRKGRITMRTITLVVLLLTLGTDAAYGAFTTPKCLVGKYKAWGKFRQCQRIEELKFVQRKASDPAKCRTKLDEQLAKLDAKAAKAAVACRFRDNGDGTVTDADTGLMWEKKLTELQGFPCEVFNVPSCASRRFNWFDAMSTFIAELNGAGDFQTQTPRLHYTDWRLPNFAELRTIVDVSIPNCPSEMAPCIDAIFGPTALTTYWSSTLYDLNPDAVLAVGFDVGGGSVISVKTISNGARAVRNAF
jgi:hypothetical protein